MKTMLKQQSKFVPQTNKVWSSGKKRLPYVMKKDELLHMLNKIDDAKLAMVIFIGCFQGLRIGEIIKLRWEDLDLDNGEMLVKDAKNTKRFKTGYGKDRKVPINEMFIPTYRKFRSMFPRSNYVIPTHYDRRNVDHLIKYYQDKFQEALNRSGLLEVSHYQTDGKPRYKYHLHTLRHICGTNLYRAGLDLYKIKKYLGHENIDTTQVYCELAIDDLRSASHLAYAYPKSRLAGPEKPIIEININAEQLQLQKEILDRQLELAKMQQVIEVRNHGYLPQQEIRV